MAATLPDDLVLEYDLMQLVDGDDSVCSNFLDACADPVALSHVDQLMVNCSVGVSIATDAAVSSPSYASSTGALGAVDCSSATAIEAETITPDDFADFLLDGEQFNCDVESVVPLNLDRSESQKTQTALENSDGSTDGELLASPYGSAPSTILSTVDESPFEIEVDAFDVKSLKLEEVRELSVPPMDHILPPMSPSRLLHLNSVLSETSSLGHSTAGRLTPSPMPVEESVNVSEDSEKYDEEDEEMDDESLADEVDLLGKEVKYLDAQVDFLQSRAKSIRPRRQCIKQRRSQGLESRLRVKSQKDNQLLNELVMQHKTYQDNLKAMLELAPVNEVRMALMTPMESYIRLGKDFKERRQTLLSLRKEKLDMTYNFIEQKAAGLDYNKPYQYSDMFEKFGKHYCVNFAIYKYDGVSVFQVGRALYEQIAGNDEVLNQAMGSTTIRESFDMIKCNFMHQRIVSSMKWGGDSAEKMPDMESNAIFYCRFGDNSAVLSTDYIDQDELHPYDVSNCIRKDVSSGVVLSGHTDDNGRKFVVMKRYLMAKYHMYPHKVSKEQQDRFFADMPECHAAMKSLIIDRLQQDEICRLDKAADNLETEVSRFSKQCDEISWRYSHGI